MASPSKINWNGLKNPKITAGDAAIRLMEIRQIYEPMVQRALGFSSHTILWSGEGDSKYRASISFVTKLNALFKAGATNIRYDNELKQIFYTHGGVEKFRTCKESLWVGHWDGPQSMALRFWFANPENSMWAERPQDFNWRAPQEESSWTTIEDQVSPSIATSKKQQTRSIQATQGQETENSSDDVTQPVEYKSESGYLIDFSSEEEKAWSSPEPAFASHWKDLREINKTNTTETGDTNIDPISTLTTSEINRLIQEATSAVSTITEELDDTNQISKLNISETVYLLDDVNDINSNTTEEEDQNIDHLSKLSMNDISMLLSYPRAEAAMARAWSKARGCIPVKHNKFGEGAAWWNPPPASALPVPAWYHEDEKLRASLGKEGFETAKMMTLVCEEGNVGSVMDWKYCPPASALPIPKFFDDREDLIGLPEKEGLESSTEMGEDSEDEWESDNSKEDLDDASLFLFACFLIPSIFYCRSRTGESIPSHQS